MATNVSLLCCNDCSSFVHWHLRSKHSSWYRSLSHVIPCSVKQEPPMTKTLVPKDTISCPLIALGRLGPSIQSCPFGNSSISTEDNLEPLKPPVTTTYSVLVIESLRMADAWLLLAVFNSGPLIQRDDSMKQFR